MAASTSYGYGPEDLDYPTIIGFYTLDSATERATEWLSKEVTWDSELRSYVPVERNTRRVAKLYEITSDHRYIEKGEIAHIA